jgi:hypothetical protein
MLIEQTKRFVQLFRLQQTAEVLVAKELMFRGEPGGMKQPVFGVGAGEVESALDEAESTHAAQLEGFLGPVAQPGPTRSQRASSLEYADGALLGLHVGHERF